MYTTWDLVVPGLDFKKVVTHCVLIISAPHKLGIKVSGVDVFPGEGEEDRAAKKIVDDVV